jgi:signal peptidase I
MMEPGPVPARSSSAPAAGHSGSPLRHLVEATALFLVALLLFRALAVEPYNVPTGSMAPALLGHHRDLTCPECGLRVCLGTGNGNGSGENGQGPVSCPHCGHAPIDAETLPVCPGDHVLVNKFLFDCRGPRRWETAVFRRPGQSSKVFVKRVIGRPGEAVLLRDGDVYIDHDIARKALPEVQALRILVFDQNDQPKPRRWDARWESLPRDGAAAVEGPTLVWTAREVPDDYQWLVYRHTVHTSDRAVAVCDDHVYNGTHPDRVSESVHDFLVECDLEVRSGDGWFALALTDGGSEVLAEFPVGRPKEGARLSEVVSLGTAAGQPTVYRTAPDLALSAAQTSRIVFAFVDRRASLSVDGHEVVPPLDRPALDRRGEVVRPVRLGARGVDAVVRNFRLYRDVHYRRSGRHGVDAPLRLGAGQYFVLGDNSACSEDSRFWSDADGNALLVPRSSLLGKPFLVHLPSRLKPSEGGWKVGIDWARIRWLR